MRYAFAPIAFGLGANALVVRQATQCFKLEASGGASGVLGQLDDGQNRVGNGGLPTSCYCLDGNGGFTDSNGRGCILTPPTTQFQCDVGATPTNGFAVGPNGGVTYNGSGKFYACPVNDNGEYNVYTTPAPGQAKCVEISLGSAGSCGAGATQPAGSQPAGTPPVATATVPAGTPPAATYPAGTPPAGTPPAGTPPAGTPPAGTPPAGTPPVATATVPAGTPPAGKPSGMPGKPSDMPGKPGQSGMPGKPSGMPGKPSGMPEYPGQPGKPQQSGKPGYPAMSEGQKPSQPAPGVPQESECVHSVVTVTVTAPAAPPAETHPAPPAETHPAPSETKPAPPAETHPAPPAETHPAPPAETHPAPPAETHPAPPAETHPAPSVTKPAPPAETTPTKPDDTDDDVDNGGEGSCPKDLNGNYEYPHLIVPVDSEQPDKAHDTSYNGKIDSHTCTIFNFDIPASMAGKKCSAMFMLPKKEDLETSDYTMSGHGKCTISKLKGPADAMTTYKNMPAKDKDVASMEMTPGNTYPVETGDCEAGKTVSYMICGSGDFSMDYFQDYNPSPIGMYVRQC
ncbi:hypothetical protein J4E93_008021 [Alternaria ventricosa]|uniref:uncharacterized protein n=1 Tax=Alternaria ventricosa TaxID=1187951 RepID=UPI0020C53BC1|nr:uncharacterized protein J4E93_008021 [Alternaria ventricosa]KAI4641143.1 hypothetical protein J4E93_008021 [Alternaria ventricosa]